MLEPLEKLGLFANGAHRIPASMNAEQRFAVIHPSEYHRIKTDGKLLSEEQWQQKLAAEIEAGSNELSPLQKQFFTAIRKNNVTLLKDIIKTAIEKPDVTLDTLLCDNFFWRNVNPLSPAQPLISEEIREIIWEFIIKNTPEPHSLLCWAIRTHQVSARIATILEPIPDLRTLESEEDNSSVLHEACFFNQTLTVKLLLERNADVNARDDGDNQPLHYACWNNHTEIVRLLLTKKINLDVIFEALESVCDNSPKITRLLEEYLLQRDRYGNTCLHYDLHTETLLLEYPGAVNALIDYSRSTKSIGIMDLMLKYEQACNDALQYAHRNGQTHIVEYLLDLGADPNAMEEQKLHNGYHFKKRKTSTPPVESEYGNANFLKEARAFNPRPLPQLNKDVEKIVRAARK
jgi:hypothetical protein